MSGDRGGFVDWEMAKRLRDVRGREDVLKYVATGAGVHREAERSKRSTASFWPFQMFPCFTVNASGVRPPPSLGSRSGPNPNSSADAPLGCEA